MLFGIGTAILAALVYGVVLWIGGILAPQQTVVLTHNMMEKEITTQDPQLHYWALFWALVAVVEMAVLGSFGAFVASIIFRNEKSEIKQHKK